MTSEYNYTGESCPKESAERVLKEVFSAISVPGSLIDIGCGNGSWIEAASSLGVRNLLGIDGAWAEEHSNPQICRFEARDFESEWEIPEGFVSAICLEVGEHLSEPACKHLVQNLCQVSEYVVFSAACPHQQGQGHISCHWPQYWQDQFNRHGFVCDAAIRSVIWEDDRVLPWYRQNLFIARRDPEAAGLETRILPVIHPQMLRHLDWQHLIPGHVALDAVESGSMSIAWYLFTPIKALLSKITRKLIT